MKEEVHNAKVTNTYYRMFTGRVTDNASQQNDNARAHGSKVSLQAINIFEKSGLW